MPDPRAVDVHDLLVHPVGRIGLDLGRTLGEIALVLASAAHEQADGAAGEDAALDPQAGLVLVPDGVSVGRADRSNCGEPGSVDTRWANRGKGDAAACGESHRCQENY